MMRLAIVGVTGYGWGLVQKINAASEKLGCRLVAAADDQLAKLPERAKELEDAGVELFDDALVMFEALRGKCEGVYIATGIGSHAPLAIAAARAGYHVHLEKPPAATVQEVDAMLTAFAEAERFCLVGFQALHSPDVAFIKERIVDGRLGRVTSLTCRAGWPRNKGYYGRNAWAGNLRHGNAWVLDGPAMNALAHQVTNMLFLASPEAGRLATPASVRAELYVANAIESHDTAAIEIHTAEGPTAWFLASHCSDESFGPITEIEAEGGHVVWPMWKPAVATYADGTQESSVGDKEMGRDRMIANFVEAVREGDGSLLRCPLSETRQFVLALDGAHESSRHIQRIAAPHARRVDEPTPEARTIVDGMDEWLVRCAERRCLFSRLPDAPPWAVATEAFDMAGYTRFPVQFDAE